MKKVNQKFKKLKYDGQKRNFDYTDAIFKALHSEDEFYIPEEIDGNQIYKNKMQ